MADQQQPSSGTPAGGAALALAGLTGGGALASIPPVLIAAGSANEVLAGVLAAHTAAARAITALGLASAREALRRDYPDLEPDVADRTLQRYADAFVEASVKRVEHQTRRALTLPTREQLIREAAATVEREAGNRPPNTAEVARLALRLVAARDGKGSRETAVRTALSKEQRAAASHVAAQVGRAVGIADQRRLEIESPDGGLWLLDPSKRTHTPGCVALHGRLWNHESLRAHPPALHVGCGCRIRSKAWGVANGYLRADAEPEGWKVFMAALAHEHEPAVAGMAAEALEELQARGIEIALADGGEFVTSDPLVVGEAFDPREKRDKQGRWTRQWERAASEFRGTLSQMADLFRRSGQKTPPGFRYNSPYEMVTKKGRAYEPQDLPDRWRDLRGPTGSCYRNAADPVLSSFDDPPELRYVEGYALADGVPFPIHHAWLVDENDRVVEVTWPQVGIAYIGVEIAAADLRKFVLKHETYGPFIEPLQEDERAAEPGARALTWSGGRPVVRAVVSADAETIVLRDTQGREEPVPRERVQLVEDFDSSELRDWHGRWTRAGSIVPDADAVMRLRPDFLKRALARRHEPTWNLELYLSGMGTLPRVAADDGLHGALEYMAKERNGLSSVEEYEQELTAKLRRLLSPERAHVAIRVWSGALPSVLDRDAVVNVHDAEHFAPEHGGDRARRASFRHEWESRVWNVDAKDPRTFPVYGYLAEDDEDLDSGVSGFGDVKLRLRPAVRERATFIYSDSNYQGVGDGNAIPRPVNEPDATAVPYNADLRFVERLTMGKGRKPRPYPEPGPDDRGASAMKIRNLPKSIRSAKQEYDRDTPGWRDRPDSFEAQHIRRLETALEDARREFARELEDAGKWDPWEHGDFFEAQIFGGVRPSTDVESVEFMKQPDPAVTRRLDELGIPWSAPRALAEDFEEEHPRDRLGRWVRKAFPDHDVLEVGGAVRDDLLGRDPKDVDYVVMASPAEIARRVRAAGGRADELRVRDRLVGVRAHVEGLTDPEGLDVAPPRVERSTGPGRKDFEIVPHPAVTDEPGDGTDTTGDPIADDAVRRDFTLNAIYRDARSGTIVDPLHGRRDLERGVLRTTSPDSFRDDPLRMLRGIRFISRYGFRLSPETEQQMRAHAPHVSAMTERGVSGTAREELNKTLMGEHVGDALRTMRDTGLLAAFLPELAPAIGFDQESRYHNLTLDEHIISVVENAAAMGAPLEVRLAALFHDAGKPETAWRGTDGKLHYYALDNKSDSIIVKDAKIAEKPGRFGGALDHETLGAEIGRDALTRLGYDSATTKRVERLIQHHMVPVAKTRRDAKIRRWVAAVGPDLVDDLLLHREADMKGKAGGASPQHLEDIAHLRARVRDASGPTDLSGLAVSGRDLLDLGMSPGPAVGEVLRGLFDDVLRDPGLNNREWLLARGAMLARKAGANPRVEEDSKFEMLHPRSHGKFKDKVSTLGFSIGLPGEADAAKRGHHPGLPEELRGAPGKTIAGHALPPKLKRLEGDAAKTVKGFGPGYAVFVPEEGERDGMIAVGVDRKGRVKREYSDGFKEGQARAKFARVSRLAERLPAATEQMLRDAETDDSAAAVLLMRATGLRPGSRRDTLAEAQAVGATTLRQEHVVVSRDAVQLSFIGKGGKDLSIPVTDPDVADMLRRRVARLPERPDGREDARLFDTDERRANEYLKRVAGQDFKVKDLRTALGTAIASDAVSRVAEPPESKAAAGKLRKRIAEEVSGQLGNTPNEALRSYIAPDVWRGWP